MTDKVVKSGDKRLENLSRNGRPKGVPNKSTALAREAIAKFVDGNSDRLQEWLDAIDRKSTRLNSSHSQQSRMPSSA